MQASSLENCAPAPFKPSVGPTAVCKLLARKGAWLLPYLAAVGLALEVAARGVSTAVGKERILTHDATTGWRLVPSTRKRHTDEERPYVIRINSHGFRGPERDRVKPAGIRRVVVLGNSFVFGAGGVEEEDTFCRRLESMWPRTEVLNMGLFGFSTDQQYLLLREKGIAFEPDLVVLGLSATDLDQCFTSYADRIGRPKGFLAAEPNGVRFQSPPVPFVIDRLAELSYVVALIDRRMQISSSWHRRHRIDVALSHPARLKSLRWLLEAFRDLCAVHQIRLAVVVLPTRAGCFSDTEKELAALAAQAGIRTINLAQGPPFDEPSRGSALFFLRDIHLNEAGHREVANQLRDFLARDPVLAFRNN